MADVATPAFTAASAIQTSIFSNANVVEVFGYNLNLTGTIIAALMLGILFLFYRIQKLGKLDFADMITKDGKSVSLTKVLQLIGGVTATWIMIKLTVTGGLTEALFGLYLTYVGAIEGYSKFVAAKYNYSEKSVKDVADEAKPPKE
jgi:peptidoglycan biosynthesis protein MviN/MurJ (putative lipid II flippase)